MRTLAFAVLSTITAMLLTLDTAEAHWRPTTQTWRCPPCIFSPPYPGGLIGLFVSGAIGGTDTGISIVFEFARATELRIFLSTRHALANRAFSSMENITLNDRGII